MPGESELISTDKLILWNSASRVHRMLVFSTWGIILFLLTSASNVEDRYNHGARRWLVMMLGEVGVVCSL